MLQEVQLTIGEDSLLLLRIHSLEYSITCQLPAHTYYRHLPYRFQHSRVLRIQYYPEQCPDLAEDVLWTIVYMHRPVAHHQFSLGQKEVNRKEWGKKPASRHGEEGPCKAKLK